MNCDISNNKVFLQGEVETEPIFNHKVKDDEFYGFDMMVPRLSGQNDIIPVIISKRLVEFFKINKGKKIAIRGQFRSYNKIEEK